MTENKLLGILKDIGLEEKEATVYLAMLELGPTTVLKVSRATEIKRTTIYSTIDSLKNKGLIREDVKGLKTLIVAENPNKLELVLEDRARKFKNSLNEFMTLYNLGEEGQIKYYEGLNSVKTVYESLIRDIRPNEDYLILSNAKGWEDLDKDFILEFTEKRARLPISIKALVLKSDFSNYLKKYEKNFNMQVRFLPDNTDVNVNLVVTPQRVLIHQLTQPIMAIVIENKNVIKMQTEMFSIIWKSIKES